jgi:DNA gyrase subunit A
LGHFLDFRREVIIKRTTFELLEAEQRAHILEGLKKALEDIDNIIQIIRGSSNPEAAKESLISSYEFSDKQAKAILDMRLQKLTSLEIDKIVQEYNDLQVLIKELNHILESHEKQSEIIESELAEVLNKHGDERRTEIIPFSGELSLEDMIADEEMIVTITHNGYIKRLPADTWKTQRRGGKGMKGAKTKDDDFVEHLFTASTHNTMLFFTDQGKCHWLKVHQIPQASRTSQGRAIVNLIGCETGEKVSAFVSVKEFSDSNYIIMATKKGMINRTSLSLYSKPRKGGVFAMEIKEGDELIQAKISNGNDNIIMATREGKSIRFKEEDVRATGRRSEDEVIGMLVLKNDGHVLVASENGYGKKSPTDEYRIQQRSGKGVYTLKKTQKTGSLVSILEVVDTDDIMIITSAGVMIRQATSEIRTIGRNTQGVRLIRLDEGAKISSVAKVVKEEEEEEKEEENTSSETKENTAE